MRILYICGLRSQFDVRSDSLGGFGGIEAANIEISRALAARGHEVSLATPSTAPDRHLGVTGIPLDQVGAQTYDVVVSSNDARHFDRVKGSPVKILWQHNPMTLERAVKKGQWGAIRKHRPRLAALGVRSEWQISHHLAFSERTVVPLGLSAAFHAPLPQRERGDYFVWSSQKQRGLFPTLKAWIELAGKRASSAEMHIFGTTRSELPYSDDALAGARVVAHERTGKLELAQFYAGARGMFCPGAFDETFCLAAAEAQAMGLPVLSLGIGSLLERVQHGVNGLIVTNHDELARAAFDLTRQPELWAQLSAGAMASGRLYSWDRAAAMWEARVLPWGT